MDLRIYDLKAALHFVETIVLLCVFKRRLSDNVELTCSRWLQLGFLHSQFALKSFLLPHIFKETWALLMVLALGSICQNSSYAYRVVITGF